MQFKWIFGLIEVSEEKYYSQTKWNVPLKFALMNWLFETWTR